MTTAEHSLETLQRVCQALDGHGFSVLASTLDGDGVVDQITLCDQVVRCL